jgi:hypothetical protein
VSNGQAIRGSAKENQLQGGIGYWLVTHDYLEDSFDQEIMLKPLDPMLTYLDCDIQRVDGSDAMWGFTFFDWNRKEFERANPNVVLPPASRSSGLDDKDDWITKDSVRIAEYYRINITEDEFIYVEDEKGERWSGYKSEIPDEKAFKAQIEEYSKGRIGKDFKRRKVDKRQLQWFKIGGNEIMDRRTAANGNGMKGKYIPIIREVGREKKIEGRLYRSGLVRALKDAQRGYNYNSSGEVEVVALQTKTPWIVAAAAIEGNEGAWAQANVQNAAYLTYRHTDEDGNEIPKPERMQPPTPAQGFLEGMRISAAEMEMVSGLPQAQQVNPALERTPAAIKDRVQVAEVVNYDFTDNEIQAIRHEAVVIMDLAPHIYDTKRLVKIRAKDGTISEVMIDPDADSACCKTPDTQGEEKTIKVLFNPKIGKYAIEADVGPAFQTQRQAAWDAFIQLIGGDPSLVAKIGDLGFLAADFPMAQEIAERLRRDIEQNMPWLLKDGQAGPVIQKLTGELQNAQSQVAELIQKLADARLRMRSKDELRDIEAKNAETKRFTAEADASYQLLDLGESEGLRILIQKELGRLLGFKPDAIEKANKANIEQQQSAGDSEPATANGSDA